jgi:5-methylthioadenosine/S-adenosylhomocysteine deaminase
VGPAAAVPEPPGVPTHAYPRALLLPGFVNVHTHLELHHLRGGVPEADFVDWLQHIRRVKERSDEAAYLEAALEGVREAWRYGTTTVADTGTSGATVRALAQLGGRGIYYHEVIAPHPLQARTAYRRLAAAVERLVREASPSVRIGVSPHAPYTVAPRLVTRVARFARAHGLPVAAHVAESRAESQFITAGSGPFAQLWRSRFIPLPGGARSPVAYCDRLDLLGTDFLAIHVVQTDAEDAATLARRGCAAAICVRSNARHGHGTPPVRRLWDAGVRLGLGTDSVASVADLDLLAEARAVRALADLTAEQTVQLLTFEGAEALGMAHRVGSLDVGKWADLCVLRAPAASDDPAGSIEAILATGSPGIVATYVAGRRVHRAGRADEGGGVRLRSDFPPKRS